MKKRIIGLVRKKAELSDILQKQETCDNFIVDTSQDECETEESEPVENDRKEKSSFEKYSVLWGKPSTRKHKKWEGDGILEVTKGGAKLYGEDKQYLSSRNSPLTGPLVGQIVMIGSKEVEIIELLSSTNTPETKEIVEKPIPVPQRKKFKSTPGAGFANVWGLPKNMEAFVLPTPPAEHQWDQNPNKKPINKVCVDGFLTARLRPHQKDGITFLYQCIMGFVHKYTGAILADEMGLGKTLQCISLMWTLLKYGPYGVPVVRQVLIITPSTLCSNWQKEILKWLGRERLTPFVIDNTKKPDQFFKQQHKSVMIISYERFVKYFEDIEKIKFHLIICDEAHRLKNANIKAAQALKKLSCDKRILLTGTPVQNHLQEYFVLVDICNPGLFGTYAEFKEMYEDPILKSQHPHCTAEEKSLGEECAARLQLVTSSFILRRTQNLLKDFLPSKTEYIICCAMSDLQKKLYSVAIETWWNRYETQPCSPLTLINYLKKICNYPHLILNCEQDDELFNNLKMVLTSAKEEMEESGKFLTLCNLINSNIAKNEKSVIVSSSTKMLDVVSKFLKGQSVDFARLDGNTPSTQRQHLVDNFNQKYGPPVFLLSSHAGGVGLSLPAASTLILYDSDWNPAIDKQAMARIWRDGQKSNVSLYRLLTTGSIEEKIYQRQMYKMGISDAVSDPDNIKSTLKMCTENLKELFYINFESNSITHDLLSCDCKGEGENEMENDDQENTDFLNGQLGQNMNDEEKHSSINQLNNWQHYTDEGLKNMLEVLNLDNITHCVTFMFRKQY